MATITTRSGKGSPLTNTEVDDNFTNLNTDKIENVVEDTTPQLGGNLDLNGNSVTGTGAVVLTSGSLTTLSGNIITSGGYVQASTEVRTPKVTSESGNELTLESATAIIKVPDGDFMHFGNDGDVQIGRNSFFGSDWGQIYFAGQSGYILPQNDFYIKKGDVVSGETMASFIGDGAVSLYYDNALKIATTSAGIDVTGEVQCDSLDVDGAIDLDITTSGDAINLGLTGVTDGLTGPNIKLSRLGNAEGGAIEFEGSHTYAPFRYASIEGYTESGSVPGYNGSVRFKNADVSSITLIERMRMNQYGIVVNEDGDAGTDFRVESASKVNALFVDASADTVYMGASALNAGALCTSASTVIAGTANSTSTAVLCVQDLDSTVSYNVIAEFNFAADTSFTRGYYSLFSDSGGFQGGIYGTGGGSVVYLTSSDERVKENIEDTGSKIDLIKSLQVRDYTRKSNGRAETGFIAQELNEHIPNAVGAGTDADENGDYIPWGVDYGAITPHLTNALQEAITKIEALEARVAELEGSNNG